MEKKPPEFSDSQQKELQSDALHLQLQIKDHMIAQLELQIQALRFEVINMKLQSKVSSFMYAKGLTLDSYEAVRDDKTGKFSIKEKTKGNV